MKIVVKTHNKKRNLKRLLQALLTNVFPYEKFFSDVYHAGVSNRIF